MRNGMLLHGCYSKARGPARAAHARDEDSTSLAAKRIQSMGILLSASMIKVDADSVGMLSDPEQGMCSEQRVHGPSQLMRS